MLPTLGQDRETAISQALELLLPSRSTTSSAAKAISQVEFYQLFIEKEAILVFEDRVAQHDEIVRRTLRSIAEDFCVTEPMEEVLRQATELICRPAPFPEALSYLKSLSKEGYTILLISPFEEKKLIDLLEEDLSCLRLSGRVLHIDSIYSKLNEDVVQSVIDTASSIHPEVILRQILMVTSSVVRTVEACNPRGIPTALVHLRHSLNIRLDLITSAPTFNLVDLSELSSRLEEIVVSDTETPAEPVSQDTATEEDDEEFIDDLAQPHRIAELYQVTDVLGSGSFGEYVPESF
jgi:hypothetical protein